MNKYSKKLAEKACIDIFKHSTIEEINNYSQKIKNAWEVGKELSKKKNEKDW